MPNKLTPGKAARARHTRRHQSKSVNLSSLGWAKFIALFALLFLGSSMLNQVTRERTAPYFVGQLSARPAGALINLVTQGEQVKVTGNIIVGRARIIVGQGCDGMDGLLLVAAAMLAFPQTRRRTFIGLLLGISVLHTCNLVRIAALYHVLCYWPQHFKFAHELVGQTLIVLVGSCLFFVYTRSYPQIRQ